MNFQRIRDLEQKVALKTATGLEKEELDLHKQMQVNLDKQNADAIEKQTQKLKDAAAQGDADAIAQLQTQAVAQAQQAQEQKVTDGVNADIAKSQEKAQVDQTKQDAAEAKQQSNDASKA
jgi:hypothetical protein